MIRSYKGMFVMFLFFVAAVALGWMARYVDRQRDSVQALYDHAPQCPADKGALVFVKNSLQCLALYTGDLNEK